MYIEEKFCSVCGKEIDDLKCNVEINFGIIRKTTNDTWEEVPNSFVSPREVMCKDCFDSFVIALETAFKEEK